LRSLHADYNSQIDANALYDARAFRKAVLVTHHYPRKLNPRPLLRKQDFRIEGNQVSIIYKPRERLRLGVFPSKKQLRKMKQARTKGARLVERDGKFFLNLVLEKDVCLPRREECETIVGVDVGINYLAVCSALLPDGRFTSPLFFHGGKWRWLCDRKRKVARSEEFERLTRKQDELLHVVSKRIVEYAKQFSKPIIVLERLSKFRNNSWNKRWNFLLGNWPRRKLQRFIEYKASWEGIPVVRINPAHTSVICHYCGARGKRDGLTFKCTGCGRQYNADSNASMNLARRFRQLLDEPKAVIGERSGGVVRTSPEGETRLPRQTHAQPASGSQMKRMTLNQTLRLPLAVGGD